MDIKRTGNKIANNILELLVDPTVVPVQQRLYFRPEEILDNRIYEVAKQNAFQAYGDQRHNFDFYPQRNRLMIQKEGSAMDRKTLIASLDILSKNFTGSDPIAKDLRTMAYAVSKMSDDELSQRLVEEGKEVEAKAKTFPCPVCGTKVLEQTKYCVKCKKKVQPKKAMDEAEREKLASAYTDFVKKYMKDNPDSEISDAATAWKKKADDEAAKAVEAQAEASEEYSDFWTKEASDAVAQAIVADVKGAGKIRGIPDGTGPYGRGMGPGKGRADGTGLKVMEEAAPEPEKKEEVEAVKAPAPVPEKKEEVEAVKAPEKKEEEVPVEKSATPEEKKVEAGKVKGPGIPDGTGPMSGTPACPMNKEDKKEDKKEVEADKVVNTDVLANKQIDGYEFETTMMTADDIGEMSADEKAKLDQLFQK